AFHLVQHAARLHRRHPELDVALAVTHTHFDGLLRDGLVGIDADPELAAALDVARDAAARGLDLARGHVTVRRRLEAVLAAADRVRDEREATIAALLDLAVFGALGLQHDLASRLLRLRRAARRTLFGGLGLRFLLRCVQVENLALVDPHLDAD